MGCNAAPVGLTPGPCTLGRLLFRAAVINITAGADPVAALQAVQAQEQARIDALRLDPLAFAFLRETYWRTIGHDPVSVSAPHG